MKAMKTTLGLFLIFFLTAGSLDGRHKDKKVTPSDNSQGIEENDNGREGDSTVNSLVGCKQCMIVTEQKRPSIEVVDIDRSGRMMWSWSPENSNISKEDVHWFLFIDEVKPVYNLKYLLVNASGGGTALVRTSDGKAVFYAYVGKNPHSTELLPDGNIVAASSTDNRLVIFHVDTSIAPNSGYRKIISLPFAHNVVWDKKRKVLWSAGKDKLYEFEYNFDYERPDLIPKDSFMLPGNNAHDLFPVYGKDSLFLTNGGGVYYIDMNTKEISKVNTSYQRGIKSITSGPDGWPTILQKPTEKWWSDQVINLKGQVVFKHPNWKIYKARWFLPNLFSYPENDQME